MYSEKELNNLVLFSGDSDVIPPHTYRYATRNECRKKGVGIGFMKMRDSIVRRYRLFGRPVEDLCLPTQQVQRQLIRFLHLVIASGDRYDNIPQRRLCRRRAFLLKIAKSAPEYIVQGTTATEIANRIIADLRNMPHNLLFKIANSLNVNTMLENEECLQRLLSAASELE